MHSIYKYPLDIIDYQVIKMPPRSQILCAQVQHGKICLWAKVPLSTVMEERRIYIYGTGSEMPPVVKFIYIGTVQLDPYVWHVFEEPRI